MDERPSVTEIHRGTAAAWDVVAREKYGRDVEKDLERLRSGWIPLLPPEATTLAPVLPGARVVHLQCSHGLETLGLLNAGAARVTGLDISREMIGLARRKARLLGVPASFLVGDVVAPPPELAASADLVYTGKGALPWIMDLDGWGEAVVRILRPGGRVYVFDGHPLANLWDRESDTPRLRPEVGYFDPEPRENPGFPGSVVRRELGDEGPGMLERFWRPGEVIGSLLRAGCVLEAFDEHPYPFWDQFPGWSAEIGRRLPSTYSVLARLP